MRSKVIINLSTDDPVEAEILDMLTGIKTSHRKQERLRSILKSGYNLLYKNMSADMAMIEAFDKQDVALILSLFGKNPTQAQAQAEDVAKVHETRPEPIRDAQRPPNPPIRPVEQKGVQTEREVRKPEIDSAQEREPALDAESPNVAPPPSAQREGYRKQQTSYRDIIPQLEEDKVEMLDFDPGLLHLESEPPDSEPEEYIDPLKKLFSK